MTDLRHVWRFYVLAHEGKCVRFAGLSCVKAGGCQQPLWFAVMYVRTDVYSQFMYLYQGQYRTSCSQPRKFKSLNSRLHASVTGPPWSLWVSLPRMPPVPPDESFLVT